MGNPKGPRFIQYFQPVIQALRDLGASAKPREVYDWILEHEDVPTSEVEQTTKGGQPKFENKVGWAKFYLSKAGFIDSEQRGVWLLTESGRTASFTHEQAYELFRSIHDTFSTRSSDQPSDAQGGTEDTEDDAAPTELEFINQNEIQEQLVLELRGLTPTGFEELCARLLRHLGFESVKVRGGSGDEGIDGEGYLLINEFVRSKVMFQCKRYEGSVGPEKIRDFRGSIQGRAERGILLTTGTFTKLASKEAARENAVAIELVDIDRLIELIIREKLGVRETKALQIDAGFFKPYQ